MSALLWHCGSMAQGALRPHSLKSDEQPFASRAETEREKEREGSEQKKSCRNRTKDTQGFWESCFAACVFTWRHCVVNWSTCPATCNHVGTHEVHHRRLLLAGYRLQHPRWVTQVDRPCTCALYAFINTLAHTQLILVLNMCNYICPNKVAIFRVPESIRCVAFLGSLRWMKHFTLPLSLFMFFFGVLASFLRFCCGVYKNTV